MEAKILNQQLLLSCSGEDLFLLENTLNYLWESIFLEIFYKYEKSVFHFKCEKILFNEFSELISLYKKYQNKIFNTKEKIHDEYIKIIVDKTNSRPIGNEILFHN